MSAAYSANRSRRMARTSGVDMAIVLDELKAVLDRLDKIGKQSRGDGGLDAAP